MDLHPGELAGATLDQVSVDWRNGIVVVSFLVSGGGATSKVLRAADFSRVEVPRSRKDTSHRVREVVANGDLLTIAMESGDELRINAKEFAIASLS
ncbi:MAG: hypothetical protein ACRELY_00730 [Polyangiaceae bacterium]